MASTTKKNSLKDYKLEINQHAHLDQYKQYKYQGTNYDPAYPGFAMGLTRMPHTDITNNAIDIESQLRGIGLSNLVNPKPLEQPSYKTMGEFTLVPNEKVILPDPLIVEKYQRPLP